MKEIERKFLVDAEKWKAFDKKEGASIQQGYIFDTEKGTLRVRIKGKKGFLTIKSQTKGMTRQEYEYEIPLEEAQSLLQTMCSVYLSKTRYEINVKGDIWEVDEFHGKLAPLLLAEIELTAEDASFHTPDFITEEVTFDTSYYNSELIKRL